VGNIIIKMRGVKPHRIRELYRLNEIVLFKIYHRGIIIYNNIIIHYINVIYITAYNIYHIIGI